MINIHEMIEDVNNKLKILSEKHDIKIYDDENPEWYIEKIEYEPALDKIFFIPKEDR